MQYRSWTSHKYLISIPEYDRGLQKWRWRKRSVTSHHTIVWVKSSTTTCTSTPMIWLGVYPEQTPNKCTSTLDLLNRRVWIDEEQLVEYLQMGAIGKVHWRKLLSNSLIFCQSKITWTQRGWASQFLLYTRGAIASSDGFLRSGGRTLI